MKEKSIANFNCQEGNDLSSNSTIKDTKVHKFEKIESESRLLLSSTRFCSVDDLVRGLSNTFDLKFIKRYGFLDIYYKDAKNHADGETLRLRVWIDYDTGSGKQVQPVQVIRSNYINEKFNGIAFKGGSKTSNVSYATLKEAQESLEKEGFKEELRILKTNGVHYSISDGEVERKIACETVTVSMSGSNVKWSSTMLEIEVLSDDRSKVARGVEEVLEAIGSKKDDLIGESMREIALKQLENVGIFRR